MSKFTPADPSALATLIAVTALLVSWPSGVRAQEGEGTAEAGGEGEASAELPATSDDATMVAGEADDPAQEPGDERLVGLTPTVNAVTGLYRTASAQTDEELTFRLGFFGQFFSGSDAIRANDETDRFIGTLGLSVSPLPWLEPYLVLSARSSSNSFLNPETVLAQGDTTLGSKAVYKIDEAFYVGGDLRLLMLTGPGSTAFDINATSVRIAALGTFDGQELAQPIPLKAHVNLGYLADNSDQLLPEDEDGRKIPPSRVERFAQGLSAYDQVEVGIGVEVPLPWVSLMAEYDLGLLAGQEPAALCGPDQPLPCPSEAGFGGNPQVLTLGVKGEPLAGLVLNGALDVGLTTADVSGVPVTAPWNLILGLAYVFDPRPKVVTVERVVEKPTVVQEKPKVGVIAGEVVDLDSADPVGGATVTYVDTELTRQRTDPDSGTFRSYEFEPGRTLSLKIEHPEYEAQTIEIEVEEGDLPTMVKLKPLGKSGTVAGLVKTPGGDPATGTVVLTGPRTYRVNLDEGRFSQKVLVGTYTVASTVSGYLTAGSDVDVAEGAPANVELSLVRRPEASVVTVTDNKLRVEGKIPFDDAALAKDAAPLLDQVAAALFEHPEFSRVRIESHTDDRGPAARQMELTEARAKAVMDYLVSKGVSAKRLEAKGFGGEQPLVPNLSARNREINKRTSFTIVSRRNTSSEP